MTGEAMRLETMSWGHEDTTHIYRKRWGPIGGWQPGRWYTGWENGETLCGLIVPHHSPASESSGPVTQAQFEQFYAEGTCPACAEIFRAMVVAEEAEAEYRTA